MSAETSVAAVRGFPTADEARAAYDDADLNRAVQAYRAFFPTVSGVAMFRGNHQVGLAENAVFGVLDTRPQQLGFTLNSDTPYGPIALDLRDGPMVVELPPGPLLCAALDVHQRWVADMGVPGPDAGNGGTHVLLPPGWDGDAPIPDGAYVARATSHRVLVGVRSLPVGGDVEAAKARIKTVVVRPLEPREGWEEETHLDVDAREKWFFQAIAASPTMFRRGAGAGSVYWLGLRDATGAHLDGSKSYTLRVPLPVPGKLWKPGDFELARG